MGTVVAYSPKYTGSLSMKIKLIAALLFIMAAVPAYAWELKAFNEGCVINQVYEGDSVLGIAIESATKIPYLLVAKSHWNIPEGTEGKVTIRIDNKEAWVGTGTSGENMVVGLAINYEILHELTKGQWVWVWVGSENERKVRSFSLTGSANAIKEVVECSERMVKTNPFKGSVSTNPFDI